jgi:hypothetical protein
MSPQRPESTEVVVPHQGARSATLSLIGAHGRLETRQRRAIAPRRMAELVAVAKERHDDWQRWPIQTRRVPTGVPARRWFAQGCRSKRPRSSRTPRTRLASSKCFTIDHPDPANDFYLHFLNTPRGKFSLHFAGKAPSARHGTRVRVRGTKLDKAIVLAPPDSLPAVRSSAGHAGRRGGRRARSSSS